MHGLNATTTYLHNPTSFPHHPIGTQRTNEREQAHTRSGSGNNSTIDSTAAATMAAAAVATAAATGAAAATSQPASNTTSGSRGSSGYGTMAPSLPFFCLLFIIFFKVIFNVYTMF